MIVKGEITEYDGEEITIKARFDNPYLLERREIEDVEKNICAGI